MTDTYALHFAPDNASLVIRIALECLDLPFEALLVDRRVQAQRSAAYLALNPLGMIPALETPDGPLFETGAILLWLGDRHAGLLPPAGAPTRGDALKWLFFLSNSLHAGLRQMFYPQTYIEPVHSDALRAGLAPRIRADFAQIDRLAASGTCFGTGDCLGLDIYAACLFRFAQLYPAALPKSWVQAQDYPALLALCANLERLPAVNAAQTAEGLGPAPFTNPIHASPPIGSAT